MIPFISFRVQIPIVAGVADGMPPGKLNPEIRKPEAAGPGKRRGSEAVKNAGTGRTGGE
jgi:hypothetical protein